MTQSFPTGYIAGANSAFDPGQPQLMPDGKSVGMVKGGVLISRDIESGKEQILAHGVSSFQFLPGSQVLIIGKDQTARIRSASGSEKQIGSQLASAVFEPNSGHVLLYRADGGQAAFNVVTGKTIEFSNKGRDFNFAAAAAEVQGLAAVSQTFVPSSDDKQIIRLETAGGPGSVPGNSYVYNVEIADASTGKVIFSGPASYRLMPGLAADGRHVVFLDTENKMVSVDARTGRKTESNQFPESGQSIFANADWSQFSVALQNGKSLVYDLATGKTQTFDGGGYFAPVGDTFCLSSWTEDNFGFQAINLRSGARTELGPNERCWGGTPDGRTWIRMNPGEEVTVVRHASLCASEALRVESGSSKRCSGKSPDHQAWLQEFVTRDLCGRDFDAKVWDVETPYPLPNPVPSELADKLLLRFQKPGGMKLDRDLPAIFAILKSEELFQRNPGLVKGMLQNVLHESPGVYEKLLPRLNVNVLTQDSSTCRTPAEEAVLKKDVLKYFDSIKNRQVQSLSDWAPLFPLNSLLKELTPAQKEEMSDVVAQSLADAAARYNFRGVFVSKLYKFALQGVQPIFGEKSGDISDLTLIQDPGVVTPIILGSRPINGAEQGIPEYGFYSKRLPMIRSRNAQESQILYDGKYDWFQSGRPFSAKVKISVAEHKALIDRSPSPAYDELWKDGKLTGLVMTGLNLGGGSADVLAEYLSYYQSKGFTFPANDEAVPDLKKFLRDQISSGETDYLIKEAHSDGDDMNLFQLAKSGKVKIGVRQVGDKQEVIRLVYPDLTSGPGVLLPNSEMASWMKARADNKGGQLLYLNSSCWSESKAVNEIQAAGTPKFSVIASSTEAFTFTDEEDSAERMIVDGIRNGKKYDEIKQDLSALPRYNQGQADHFMFPNSDEYQERIGSRLAIPLNIHLSIKDDVDQPYHIDSAAH